MKCIHLCLCVQIICWCSTSPSTHGLFWHMEDIIALKHTFPNFKKQARVHNKEHVRTAVSFKATFFRHAFRFLLLPFRIKHMALLRARSVAHCLSHLFFLDIVTFVFFAFCISAAAALLFNLKENSYI